MITQTQINSLSDALEESKKKEESQESIIENLRRQVKII